MAVEVGILPERTGDCYRANKAMFVMANPIGDALGVMLQDMVKAGVLEFREEPDLQFRWKE